MGDHVGAASSRAARLGCGQSSSEPRRRCGPAAGRPRRAGRARRGAPEHGHASVTRRSGVTARREVLSQPVGSDCAVGLSRPRRQCCERCSNASRRPDRRAPRTRSGRPAHHPGRPGAQPQGRLARPARATPSSCSPACPGPASRRLAFDTIFAEGQRRYVESLSAYARQFLGQMDKPDVDFIEGLSPAVSIDQKSTSKNPRSTVGTITEVYDYLRLLYARAGRPHCPTCGAPDRAADARSRSSTACSRSRRARRFQVLAPVIRGRKGEYVELFRQLQTAGLLPGPGQRRDPHRSTTRRSSTSRRSTPSRWSSTGSRSRRPSKRRLTDSVETALNLAGGLVRLRLRRPRRPRTPGRELKFSEKMACPNDHPIDTDELEPRSFSFNSPVRRLPGVPRPRHPDGGRPRAGRARPAGHPRRGRDPAVEPGPRRRLLPAADGRARRGARLRPQHPVGGPRRPRRRSRCSTATRPRSTSSPATATAAQRAYYAEFEGVRPYIERRHREAESDTSRERFEGFMREVPCPACQRQPAQAGVDGGDAR